MARTVLLLLVLCASLLAQPVPIAKKTAGMTPMPGFFPIYWDANAGKIWLEVNKFDTEFLYIASLPAGLGSNDIGLDRGQMGGSRVVRFERSGPKLLLVQPNYDFRSLNGDAAERRSVEDSFARSVLWGFTIEAEQNNRVLVDATSFFVRDAHGVVGTLRRERQGTFQFDASRSAIYLPMTKNFPRNTEVEATITVTGEATGQFVREVAPSADSLTVRERHSFVALPDAGYRPRPFDPRAGFFSTDFMDFSAPVGDPIRKRWIARHRLEKKDPSAAVSDAVKPIVYYLDPGAPEPIRTALLEGARWWTQAFEAAGFRNAFRVELLPDGADPLDVRYNMIQWVHRSTRGWSYGNAVTDPRTGEIIKGHVTLGSLRVRQDYLIFEGLLAPYETGKPANPAMLDAALHRLRQLSAHEVGHTLGLSHAYSSSVNDRASVMDYPGPLVELDGANGPSLKRAYSTGIGEWDKVAITSGYGDASAGEQALKNAFQKGLYFISDSDSRPLGGAHPYSHLWDNGTNAIDELERVMQVRSKALERFGENNIREGTPMSSLEEVLVPLYMGHRYQVEAASKVLGGVEYRYALRGDGQLVAKVVQGDEQKRALSALLKTIDPTVLTLSDRILDLIPPRAYGHPRNRETFSARTGLVFDPLAAVESAAGLTLRQLLHPERSARLIQQSARDRKVPGLGAVIDEVLAATWKKPRVAGLAAETQRVVDSAALYYLMSLAAENAAPSQVRAIAESKLQALRAWAAAAQSADPQQVAHLRYAASQIERFLKDSKQIPIAKPMDPPPGQPI
jgi:hypothetical protein